MKRKNVQIWILIIYFLFFAFLSESDAARLVFSWDPNTEPDLAGYRLYIGSYSQVTQKQVLPVVLSPSQYCYCFEIDDNTTKVVYVGVSAFNTAGLESELTIGWYLFGNIVGNFNEGTNYTAGRVDGYDLTILGLYFGQTVSHLTYNCNDCASIRSMPFPNDKQKSDLNRDGRIDGFDLIYLGLRFGNASY